MSCGSRRHDCVNYLSCLDKVARQRVRPGSQESIVVCPPGCQNYKKTKQGDPPHYVVGELALLNTIFDGPEGPIGMMAAAAARKVFGA